MSGVVDKLEIERVIRQRIEGIRLKDPGVIRKTVDTELYSRFDDWPPGTLDQGEEALQVEEKALKVLDEYRYSVDDLMVRVMGDVALASFCLRYDGAIRKRRFDIRSRVTMVLVKKGPRWRIMHEHFSMFPQEMPVSVSEPLAEAAGTPSREMDELDETILKVLSGGSERHIADLTKEVSKLLGREVTASQVVDRCGYLASKGLIKRRGRFYPRYQARSPRPDSPPQ